MNLLDSIRCFKRVSELQSFSAAAKDLNTTQSSVSRTVAGLEETLGVLLFRRTTRRLQLTTEGQKLLQTSDDLLAKVEEMISSVRGEKQNLKGQLRVSASITLGRIILTDLVDSFTKLQPELRLHFRLSDSYADLIEENIDVAIRMGNLADSSLKASRIGTARMKIFASHAYLKKHGIPKKIEDLHEHRLIFFSRWSRIPTWELNQNSGEKFPFNFKPYFETDAVDMVREGVSKGVGIALLPTWMMTKELAEGSVVKVLDKNSLDEIPIHAVTSNVRDQSAKQKAFIEFLRLKFEANKELSLRK